MSEVPDLLEELQDKLFTRPARVLGCLRRNIWNPPATYRHLRGNALLAAVGECWPIVTPMETFDIYLTTPRHGHRWILLFRGGAFRHWWVEDAKELCALVQVYTNLQIGGTAIFNELDGNVHVSYFPAASKEAAVDLARTLLDRWQTAFTDAPGRWPKDTARARAVCPHCPVKTQCDGTDVRLAQTQDWPKD